MALRISRGFCYRHLDKSHPADPKPYKGDGWLNKVLTEYQQRFKIDFTKGPVSFERIKELVLARNAGIHRDKGNLDRYLAKIKAPAFTDENDQFFVTRDALVAIIQDGEKFLKWVIAQIEELHPAAAAKAAKK